jgi:DNA polymerase-1
MTQALAREVGGVTIPRNGDEAVELGVNLTIKEVNFGLIYGMSEHKLGRQAGLDKKKSSELFKAYHAGAPYVKATMAQAASEVQAFGFITTILGRRTRFKMWEPAEKNYIDKQLPLPYNQALQKYGSHIKRAYEYKAINYRLQGTAADALKKAMLRCWKEGVYHVMGVPRLTVHDENGHSIVDDSPEIREATAYMIHCMETSIPEFRIPLRFDWSTGANWGEC